jgi:serine/threonine protein phosphatase PrpC
MVADGDLQSLLCAAQGGLGVLADALLHFATEAGGIDNITLCLVRVNRAGAPAADAAGAAGGTPGYAGPT